jgi:hypothetical protein
LLRLSEIPELSRYSGPLGSFAMKHIISWLIDLYADATWLLLLLPWLQISAAMQALWAGLP